MASCPHFNACASTERRWAIEVRTAVLGSWQSICAQGDSSRCTLHKHKRQNRRFLEEQFDWHFPWHQCCQPFNQSCGDDPSLDSPYRIRLGNCHRDNLRDDGSEFILRRKWIGIGTSQNYQWNNNSFSDPNILMFGWSSGILFVICAPLGNC